jgi:YfiH family protein
MRPMDEWIVPEWPAPKQIRAVITSRRGGHSEAPFNSLNLADHVGDDAERVAANRVLLRQELGLSREPIWLEQVHGCDLLELSGQQSSCRADAATTSEPGQVCAVLTADCLPLLLCNRSGSRVAAVHAGWRGLQAGVIEAAVDGFDDSGEELLAWLGPAIGPDAFEVGSEVRSAFIAVNPEDEEAFVEASSDRWMADIYALARSRLNKRNIGFIGGGDRCTVSEPERFFSYRRDGETGRMASLIWIDEELYKDDYE